MTTHQLATLLEHLQIGLGDGLKSATGTGFTEAASEFRSLPDQSLKELFKSLRKANTPQPGPGSGGNPPAGVAGVIDRIRAVRDGTGPAESVELGGLTIPQLKEILRTFKEPLSGNKGDLVQRVRQLCVPVGPADASPHGANGGAPEPPPGEELDLAAVEEGVRIFTRLRDDRKLTITDVRAGFEPLRGYPKPVVEEITRRLKYTPDGSRAEILDRLLSNLEGIKMSQYRMDQILTGA
jgi:hypothetical protein